eukprot:CAMPEP_0206387994 /NCGR_PEP_ID=MMETSP0294-20121207/16985_1 /ASSEMBLY_ACC=CAM_ASM_000327 /TAXON_ID=39354 /ORGANISM="Heterosigma akashiwo, Strain CCMP2393" /LENGTH=118 /DNA_ID=CAMNT_0053839569 /DNA_START=833 /DNA_END=1190 /DNA_ORIENTATION=+
MSSSSIAGAAVWRPATSKEVRSAQAAGLRVLPTLDHQSCRQWLPASRPPPGVPVGSIQVWPPFRGFAGNGGSSSALEKPQQLLMQSGGTNVSPQGTENSPAGNLAGPMHEAWRLRSGL